jgi:hypothetical protein
MVIACNLVEQHAAINQANVGSYVISKTLGGKLFRKWRQDMHSTHWHTLEHRGSYLHILYGSMYLDDVVMVFCWTYVIVGASHTTPCAPRPPPLPPNTGALGGLIAPPGLLRDLMSFFVFFLGQLCAYPSETGADRLVEYKVVEGR